jgi:hypothetical protein
MSDPDDLEDDDIPAGAPQYKGEDGQWYCGECKQSIHKHLDSCQTHQNFRKWYRKMLDQSEELNNKPRDPNLCAGCDYPKDGSKGHRFSCSVSGARAGQLILPASMDENGKVTVHIPGKYEPNKG